MIGALVLACVLVCVQDKPTPEEAFGRPGSGTSEVEALVERVKEQLAAVDAALQSAAEADKAAADLSNARQAHLAVIRDIEELIKQIKYKQSQSQSQGGGTGKPQKGSPSDGQPQPQPDPRESDGEKHSQPKPGSQPPQPKPKAGQPESGQPNAQPPATTPGDQPPPPPETGRFEREDTDARWGLLPPKIQERLMNLHVDDLPERYRVWMDAYIRQLNRLEQGASRP